MAKKEAKYELKIPEGREDALLVFTIGDHKRNIIPSIDELKRFQTMIEEAMKSPDVKIYVPSYVKVKKIKLGGKKVKN